MENAATVLKVIAVFETLVEERCAGLGKRAQRAMTSKTPAHRMLHTLVELCYAEQDPDTKKYSLTLKPFSLAARSQSGQSHLSKIADPEMGKLLRATGE